MFEIFKGILFGQPSAFIHSHAPGKSLRKKMQFKCSLSRIRQLKQGIFIMQTLMGKKWIEGRGNVYTISQKPKTPEDVLQSL